MERHCWLTLVAVLFLVIAFECLCHEASLVSVVRKHASVLKKACLFKICEHFLKKIHTDTIHLNYGE